jgi:hypothetical protein
MTTAASPSRRPWHLWVLGILGILWSALGAFDYLMTVTRNPAYMGQFPQAFQDYFYGLSWWYYAIWAVGIAGGLLGCIALLARSRWAVPLLALALLNTLFSLTCGFLDPAAPRIEGMEIIAAAITASSVLLFVYALVQRRRGVLR